MGRVYQPFIPPSPWGISSRRAAIEYDSHYLSLHVANDMSASEKLLDDPLWMNDPQKSAPHQTELYNEWMRYVTNPWLGMTNASTSADAVITYKGAGLDFRYFEELALLENDCDMSVMYDGMRMVAWVYWKNDDPSDSVYFQVGQRKTKGTSWGGVNFRANRNVASSVWGFDAHDGAGNTQTVNTALNAADKYCIVQAEFVCGSHAKARFVNNGSETFSMPSWPISETGYWGNISLTSAPYNDLILSSFRLYVGSSVNHTTGSPICRLYGLFFEYRAIDKEWQYLV